ncbi:hypothetical protein SLS63_012578 [Diaporthe eres]|uniref:Uncharacterized protein n=1 Tax=Diaporthe eres TaxID=83184 RepID=A0ABR1NQU1_DIAER
MAEWPARKFEIGHAVVDIDKKRKGIVMNYAFWQERCTWEYQCEYKWTTQDNLNRINWTPMEQSQTDYTGQDKLQQIEKFQINDMVIHTEKRLKGRVQNSGWKEVAGVYTYPCLWQWTTNELNG